jgi:aspartokinase-like uncharacterized kinase
MDAVIKIGGSILENPALKPLCRLLDQLTHEFSFVIIPGGGSYANLVRDFDRKYDLSDHTAHWMAILSENILGFFLLEHLTLGIPAFTVDDIPKAINAGRIPIFMPFRHLYEHDPLAHSWDVTSDSIAAYLAESLCSDKLILLKDVDGIFTRDPKETSAETAKFLPEITLKTTKLSTFHSCIDIHLPRLLKKYHRACYIVNGLHPTRLEQLLHNKKTIYTKVVP